jgi:excisionase family DNA binding protein
MARGSEDTSLFMSVAEAARALGVSDDTVYELLQRGQLPGLRIGRRRVIPRRAIDLIVEQLLAGFDPRHLARHLAGPGRLTAIASSDDER